MSASKPWWSSSGRTSAALPHSPTLSGRRSRFAVLRGVLIVVAAALDGVRETVRLLVEIASLEPAFDPLGVDLDAQRHALVHRHGERLRAAHSAQAGRQRDGPGERAAEAATRDLREALVGALDDSLAADVDPRAGGHLAVHRESERLEPAELVPGRPLPHQVRVRDQHARRPLVRAEHTHGLARLDEQRLVTAERAQRAHQCVEGLPGARRPTRPAVDHELVRPLGNLGVEIVHEHPERRLLGPIAAGELRAAGGAHGPRAHSSGPIACSTASRRARDATSASASANSGASQRSRPGPGS